MSSNFWDQEGSGALKTQCSSTKNYFSVFLLCETLRGPEQDKIHQNDIIVVTVSDEVPYGLSMNTQLITGQPRQCTPSVCDENKAQHKDSNMVRALDYQDLKVQLPNKTKTGVTES